MTADIERESITRPSGNSNAPGHPGAKPRWSSGAKTAVGTAASQESRVWFTISKGTLNELYFPSIDQANTRSLRFLVADGEQFFSDEENDADHSVRPIHPEVPAFHIATRCKKHFYAIEKQVIADPNRDALLLKVHFQPDPQHGNLRLYVFMDAHLGDCGEHNHAWTREYKGVPMLFARREQTSLAMASTAPFKTMSCGFVGVSDGLTDISTHKQMTWSYDEAKDGNAALTAEIDWAACGGEFIVAIGFGGHAAEAAQQSRAALLQKFETIRDRYVNGWLASQHPLLDLGKQDQRGFDLYRVSTAVLKTHESKRFPGAIVASLSIPWGFDRGDKDVGGYHVVWPRDMVEAAMGKLASGDAQSARRTLFYLKCTQEQDGNWTQNMWLDGMPKWTGTQMDGTAFCIILADALRRGNQLEDANPWPMIQKSAGFLARNGPVTQQDRWEEDPGYSPYTMAVEIAALLAAADFADQSNERNTAEFLRATADAWNDAIDEWTYVSGSDLAHSQGLHGYYVRITPPDVLHAASIREVSIRIKNKPEHDSHLSAVDVVSPDALALVRFGLRAADDSRITDTVKVIDATLKTTLSNGPVWHRYTNDGYGEKADGSPFKKEGEGRGWPLLTGERAHYEIARGNLQEAESLLNTIQAQTSECGLIPEQVWDSHDIPHRELYNGRPTGSGMPLVWAHAECVKLLRSLKDGRVWDTPPQPVQRYQVEKKVSSFGIWTLRQQRTRLRAGKSLRIDVLAPAKVRWSMDGWKTTQEIATADSGLGVHWALLDLAQSRPGANVQFTFLWLKANHWEGSNFTVSLT